MHFIVLYVIIYELSIELSPSGKAQDFDSCTRGFESRQLSQKNRQAKRLSVFYGGIRSRALKNRFGETILARSVDDTFPFLHAPKSEIEVLYRWNVRQLSQKNRQAKRLSVFYMAGFEAER